MNVDEGGSQTPSQANAVPAATAAAKVLESVQSANQKKDAEGPGEALEGAPMASSPSAPAMTQQAHVAQPAAPTPTVSHPEGLGSGSQPKVGGGNVAISGGAGGGSSLLGVRAADLKKALYDPNAKLVDLFGDLEPKLMLDSIMETFWESCTHLSLLKDHTLACVCCCTH